MGPKIAFLLAACLVVAAAAPSGAQPAVCSTDLIAGQHTDAGDVLVWKVGCTLFVKYVASGCWEITETHLHVAGSWEQIPQTKKGNPIPGRFDYKGSHRRVTEVTYEVDLDALGLCEGGVCIAAHAVVKCQRRTETAWGEGPGFPGKNWAMYFCLDPDDCRPPVCESPVVLNGSFEAPDVTAEQGWNIFEDGTPGLGWAVEWAHGILNYGGESRPTNGWLELMTSGPVGEMPAGWQAQDGDQWAELDSDWDGPDKTLGLDDEPASVQISQSINTCPDRTYKLTFYYSPRPDYSGNAMKVVWGVTELFSISDLAGGAGTSWTKKEYTGLVPTGTSTMLYFAETGPHDAKGMFLDNVTVELE